MRTNLRQAPAEGAPADTQQQPVVAFKYPWWCGWTFTTSYKLKRHLQSHDKLRPLWLPSRGCGKSFTTVYNLNTHEETCEQENSFKCEVCEETFPTQAKLRRPPAQSPSLRGPAVCVSSCKKTFITVSALFPITAPTSGNRNSFPVPFLCSKQYDKACN